MFAKAVQQAVQRSPGHGNVKNLKGSNDDG